MCASVGMENVTLDQCPAHRVKVSPDSTAIQACIPKCFKQMAAPSATSDHLSLLLPHLPSDINECAYQNGGCEEICVDTVGSYYCRCPPGLELSDDGKTCNGKEHRKYFL